MQRNGDELHAKIQKAEREIEGLKNTLDLVNSGNDRLRRGNKAVGAQDDDRATYAEFEKRYLKTTTLAKYRPFLINHRSLSAE